MTLNTITLHFVLSTKSELAIQLGVKGTVFIMFAMESNKNVTC